MRRHLLIIILVIALLVAGIFGLAHARADHKDRPPIRTTTTVVTTTTSPAAQDARFAENPAKGPAGTSVAVHSIDPCPVNVPTDHPFVTLAITRGSEVLARGQAPILADGSWSTTLVVSNSAAPGGAEVSAFCIASAQAEGSFLAYHPLIFVVTPPPVFAPTT